MSLPEPGETKVDNVDIYLRVRDRPDLQSFDTVYNPPEGWVIDEYQLIVNGRLGNTKGPHVVRRAADSDVLSVQKIQQGVHSLNELSASLESIVDAETDPEKKTMKLREFDELKSKFKDEFDYWMSISTRYRAKNAGLHITATTQARWRDTWVGKIYSSGGKVDADVRITRMFIGDEDYLKAHIAQYTRQLNRIAEG